MLDGRFLRQTRRLSLRRERSSILVIFWCGGVAADHRRPVNGSDLVHVGAVEQVESVHNQVEPQVLSNLEIARDTKIPRVQMVAVIGVAAEVGDAVGHGVGITIGVESDEHGERTAGLSGDDAAESEMTEEAVVRGGHGKVCDEPLTDILVGVGALERPFVQILGRADERGESTVVNRMRESVVGVQAEDLAPAFDCLQGKAVVIGIAAVVSVIEQAGVVIGRTSSHRISRRSGIAEEIFPRGVVCRRSGRGSAIEKISRSRLGHGGAGGSAEERANVKVFGADEVVSRDPHVAGADRKTVSDLPVDLEIGLLGVRNLAAWVNQSVAGRARRRARTFDELVGHLAGIN